MCLTRKVKHDYVLESIDDIPQLASMNANIQASLKMTPLT